MQRIVSLVLPAALAFMYVLPIGMAHSDDRGLTDEITFTLVDASIDQDLSTLVDEATINLAETGQELNIRADIGVPVDHVRFEMDGTDFRTEKKIPYALAGDDAGDYTSWTPEVGHYTLQATAYDATENEVASKIIYFTVVDNATDADGPTKTANQKESFQPAGHDWRKVFFGYSSEPCTETEIRDVYFPKIGKMGRKVLSAKLYTKVHYGHVKDPDPYCPPTEECPEPDELSVNSYSASDCDGSKFNGLFLKSFRSSPLPGGKEEVIDLPLNRFSCDREDRPYGVRYTHHKTNVMNQHAQIAGMRLEVEFGGPCDQPEPPPDPVQPPEEPEEPEGPKREQWWDRDSEMLESVPIDNYETFSGDYDGDGIDDIALFVDYGNTTSRVHVLLSTGNEFQPNGDSVWWSNEAFDAKTVKGKITSGDFNNDGYDDIAMIYDYNYDNSDVSFLVADLLFSTGKSFQRHFKYGLWLKPGEGYNQTGKPVTGDYDGDGIDEIAIFYDHGTNRTKFQVLRLTGRDEQMGRTWLNYPNNIDRMANRIVTGDFNNDGYDDITMIYCNNFPPKVSTRAYVFLSTGNGFQLPSNAGWWGTSNFFGDNHPDRVQGLVAGDFDRDGYDDISLIHLEQDNANASYIETTYVLSSTGSKFRPPYPFDKHYLNLNLQRYQWHAGYTSGDYNNNGQSDISYLMLIDKTDEKYFMVDTLIDYR